MVTTNLVLSIKKNKNKALYICLKNKRIFTSSCINLAKIKSINERIDDLDQRLEEIEEQQEDNKSEDRVDEDLDKELKTTEKTREVLVRLEYLLPSEKLMKQRALEDEKKLSAIVRLAMPLFKDPKDRDILCREFNMTYVPYNFNIPVPLSTSSVNSPSSNSTSGASSSSTSAPSSNSTNVLPTSSVNDASSSSTNSPSSTSTNSSSFTSTSATSSTSKRELSDFDNENISKKQKVENYDSFSMLEDKDLKSNLFLCISQIANSLAPLIELLDIGILFSLFIFLFLPLFFIYIIRFIYIFFNNK